jgi:hypothetical protein
MYLTSPRRLRRFLGNIPDTAEDMAPVISLLAGVSLNIEDWLDRDIEVLARTEYFDTEDGQRVFFPRAFPLLTITSVYSSANGRYEGEETQEADYHKGRGDRSLVLGSPYPASTRRGLRLIHTSGLASHEVESTFVVTVTQAFTVERFVRGSRSGAFGRVVTPTAGAFVIENIAGIFRVGDVLSEYLAEDFKGSATAAAGTIVSITTQGLAEAHPVITLAAEFEINYLYKNTKNSALWTAGTSKEGTTKDGAFLGYAPYQPKPLRPETQRMLHGYRRLLP